MPLIALTAMWLSRFPEVASVGLSPLPLAILLGIVWGHVNWRPATDREHAFSLFCQQKCLRAGIILLGLSLSFQQILGVGWETVLLNCIVIVSVIGLGVLVGLRLLGLPRDLAILISTGSAICGAAAVLATDSSLKSQQQYVTVSIATVVLFGTLAMFFYPLVYPYAGMDEQAFGIYIGSTVHEVAQAVAAGDLISPEALHTAVVTKLIRVMLLAPFIIMLGFWLSRQSATEGSTTRNIVIPWFVLGFIAMAAVNSFWVLPSGVTEVANKSSQFLLALAMAALGTKTHWHLIKNAGGKPLLLAFILFTFLIAGGYVLNTLIF